MKIFFLKHFVYFWKKIIFIIFFSLISIFFSTLKPLIIAGIINKTTNNLKIGGLDNFSNLDLINNNIFNLNSAGNIINNFFNLFYKNDTSLIFILSILICFFILLSLLASIFTLIANSINNYTRAEVLKKVRFDISSSLLKFGLEFFNKQKTGELISRVIDDSRAFAQGIVSVPHRLFETIILFIFYGAYLLNTNYKLTLWIVVIFILHHIISSIIKKPIGKRVKKVFNTSASLSTRLQETFANIRIIKCFGSDDYELKRLQQSIEDSSDAMKNEMQITMIEPEARKIIDSLAEGLIIFVSILQLLQGNISLEGFILYLYVARLMMMPINQFSQQVVWIARIRASFSRIGFFLSLKPNLINGKIKNPSFNNNIELQNINFNYEKNQKILKSISFKIMKGETIALVGPSGAGKSTLADLFLRLYDPTEGNILMDGVNIKEFNINSFRNIFGVVPQDSILFNDSIKNNIKYGRDEITDADIENASKIADAYKFITSLTDGFDTFIGDRGVKLSGGQKQKISIARAIAHSPKILIFDEATSSLDSESENLVQKSIDEISKQSTTLIIAHRMSTIINSDRIMLMNEGMINDIGTHNELLSRNNLYQKLCNLQFNQNVNS